MPTLPKTFIFLFLTVFVVLGSFYALKMANFKENLDKTTEDKTCPHLITSEDLCTTKYNGTTILAKFDNLPPGRICCKVK